MSRQHWLVEWHWRSWMVGLFLGPDVWGVRVGPLSLGYAP